MPYASCLASCSVVLLSDVFCSILTKFSAAEIASGIPLIGALLVQGFGVLQPFYLGCFALHPGIACLGYVHHGIACLAS